MDTHSTHDPARDALKARLDAAVARHDLLEHPFYQAWNAGTLPRQDLRTYAGEYGAFIATIGEGWDRVGEPGHAAEEAEHAQLWQRFAAALGTEIDLAPRTPEVAEMLATARELFADRVTALGALYAFEAQQPATSRSKLDGLETHYADIAPAAHDYFTIHADDYHEVDLVLDKTDDLDDTQRDALVAACARMSQQLYSALTGVYSESASC